MLHRFAKSNIGQNFFALLGHLKLTPEQYRNMPEPDRVFCLAAYLEKCRREEELYKKKMREI
jgi:hypothetical protein